MAKALHSLQITRAHTNTILWVLELRPKFTVNISGFGVGVCDA